MNNAHKILKDKLVANPPKVGDTIMGTDIYSFGGESWVHVFTVLETPEALDRFGKPNLLLTVRIETSRGCVTDHKTKRWADQLF